MLVLYIDLRPGQIRRKWHIPMASYRERSRRRAWLTIRDKVKSCVTVTDWFIGRKWPVNWMIVMFAYHAIPGTAEVTHSEGQLWGDIEWAIELLYNSVKTGSQLVWRPDPLVKRCGRESQHPAEWALRPPVEKPWRTRKTKRWWP